MGVPRNDPCPCGSGIKFKKCCGPRFDAFLAKRPTEDRLRRKIMDFVENKIPKSEWERAFEEFFGADKEVKHADWVRFLSWFIHDFRDGQGIRPMDRFVSERSDQLAPEEISILDSWRTTRPGVFEVAKILRGMGIQLRDINSGERLDVFDVSASKSLHPWDIIWARIIRTGNDYGIEGTALLFSALDKDNIIRVLRGMWEEYRKEHPKADRADFFRERFASIDRKLRNLHLDMKIRPVTREGEEVKLCSAIYSFKDRHIILEKLSSVPSLRLEGPSDDDPSAFFFNWAVLEKDVPKGETLSPPQDKVFLIETEMVERGGPKMINLGTIHVWEKRMEMECLSEGRLSRLRRIVEDALGPEVRFEGVKIKDTESLFKEEHVREDLKPLSGKEFEAFRKEAVRDYIREWITEPVPALGGISPREAVRTEQGKEKVKELLKVFVNLATRETGSFLRIHDVEEIARQLRVDLPS